MKTCRRCLTFGLIASVSTISYKRAESVEPAPAKEVAVAESRPATGSWKKLADGIELGGFPAPGGGGRELWIVRIDVKTAPLKSLSCAKLGHGPLPADEWSAKHGLRVVINAGMFETDHISHVGYWKAAGELLRAETRKDYASFAAFNPKRPGLPAFRIFDNDSEDLEKQVLPVYQDVVQNLRLVKRPCENRWKQQEKAWSEAALGEDDKGRALFIFCPVGLTMHDLNRHLLELPIQLVAAQHLEGGPEASLYVNIDGFELRGIGSYETGFNENDANNRFWSLPNVLGVTSADQVGKP